MTTNLRERIARFVRDAKADAQSGLSFPKIGDLFTSLVALLVEGAFDLDNSGSEKKAWVLEQVGKIFDQLAPSIPLPVWLAPFRSFLVPMLRRWVLSIADGAVEAIYRRLKPAA